MDAHWWGWGGEEYKVAFKNIKIYKTEIESPDRKLMHGYQRRKLGVGVCKLGGWDIHTPIYKTDNQQEPTV